MARPERPGQVSPGFTPRPSLSEVAGWLQQRRTWGSVAGVHTSAFVERPVHPLGGSPIRDDTWAGVAGVHTSAFVERPSETSRSASIQFKVSPGFTPRPSLSARSSTAVIGAARDGVAGVHTSAFVERGAPLGHDRDEPVRVAGVHTSAFVERTPLRWCRGNGAGQSVAGVHTSAFVER